jgi:hypothetical protein
VFERGKTVHALDRAATVIGVRQPVANNIQKLIKKQKPEEDKRIVARIKREYQEWNTLNLKRKINQKQLIITKADKSNSLVIIQQNDYYNKIQ